MRRLIKIILAIIVALIILAVIGLSLLIILINPNDYKDQAAQTLSKQLNNQKVSINGNMHWSFSSGVGIKLDSIVVSNPVGFAPVPFLEVNNAKVFFKLFPLVFRRIEPARIDLQYVSLNLITDQQGRNNWQAFFQHQQVKKIKSLPKVTSQPEPSKKQGLTFGKINISNGQVVWQNLKNSRLVSLNSFEMKTSDIKPGYPFYVNLNFIYKPGSSSSLQSVVDLRTTALLNLAKKYYSITNLIAEIQNQMNGEMNSLFTVSSRSVQFNGISHQLKIFGSQVRNDNLHIALNALANDFPKNPQINGSMQIWLRPEKILSWLGYRVVKPSPELNTDLLNQFSLTTKLQSSNHKIELGNIRGRLDRSYFEGDMEMALPNPQVQFNMGVNRADLDRYLALKLIPIKSLKTSSQKKQFISSIIIPLAVADPIQLINKPVKVSIKNSFSSKLVIKGLLKINDLIVHKTSLSKVSTQVNFQNKKLIFDPIIAGLGDGQLRGRVAIDMTNPLPKYEMNAEVNHVNIDSLTQSNQLTGKADMNAHLTMTGNSRQQQLQTLSGNFDLTLHDGVVKHINLPKVVEQAVKFLHAQKGLAEITQGDSSFSKLTTTTTINQGIISIHNLVVTAPLFITNGQGTLNLLNQVLHLNLNVLPQDAGGFIKNKNFAIPVLVTGTLDKPKLQPDYSKIKNAVEKSGVKDSLQKIINKQKDPKLRDTLEKGLQKYL